MILFDNDAKDEFAPAFLSGREVEENKRIIAQYLGINARERRQTDLPPVWKMTLDPSVLKALTEWSGGRCAFCERHRDDLAPYRFRPPGYAEPLLPPSGKDSYLGLCFAWSNFFPICQSCRPVQPSFFPVTGTRARVSVNRDPGLFLNEKAGLFFPGELDNPASAFRVAASGEIIGIGRKAQTTIAHFNLNDEALMTERADDIGQFLSAIEKHILRDAENWLALFLADEFGGSRYLYLRRVVSTVGQFGTVPRPRSLTPAGLQGVLLRWREQVDLVLALRTAEETIRHEDELHRRRTAKTPMTKPARSQGRHPRIAAVTITTYKSLEEISFKLPEELPGERSATKGDLSTTKPEAPCLLILGENATGKSSILEAIALACLSSEAIEQLDLDFRRMTLNPEFMGSDRAPRVMDSEITVSFHDGTSRSVAINARPGARETLSHSDDDDGLLVFAYGAHRLYADRRRRGPERHYDTLFHDNKLLSNPEAWLRKLAAKDREGLNEVVSALRHIIQIDGEFEDIDFPATGDQPSDGIIRLRKHRPNGEPFVVQQTLGTVSSGYRAILALVCDVLEGLFEANDGDVRAARMSDAIILIDEIEAHLHPRWKLQVISGLRRALPRATFVITSHDPLCLRGMFGREIMVLNRYQNLDGEGLALPERVERIDTFDNVETMTVEQLLTSDLFQLMSADDPATEGRFARVADLLAAEEKGKLEPVDARILERFRDEIGGALPFGRGEVPRLVQEAVAEFLKERRELDSRRTDEARKRAKESIKDHLRGLLA